MVPTIPGVLHAAGQVADAVVRVIALLVVMLIVAVPVLVTLLVAVFKSDAQKHADTLLKRVIELFKVILGPGSWSGSSPRSE